jgi:hypothetical protein
MSRLLISFIVLALLLPHAAFGQTVKRGRNEGTISLAPSNVIGNGNITLYAQPDARYNGEGLLLNPIIGGSIGISDIMQLTAQTVPLGTKGLGPTEAHVQLTLPGNDVLRFFGFAAGVDLFLSTALDTISLTTDLTKPDFNPFPSASLLIDLDWLALDKRLPLKTYLSVNLADNGELLYRYNQIAAKIGAEWKMNQHSLFADAGVGLYQEKRSKINPVADKDFAQYYGWIGPGGRYRLKNRFSVLAGLRFMIFQVRKDQNGIKPDFLGLSIRFEAPLLFKETNTEAIRTLIFMEQVKEKKTDLLAKSIESQHSVIGELNASLGDVGDSTETFDYSRERNALLKRREEIQSKMKEIERIFSDSEGSDSTQSGQPPLLPGGEEE